MRHRAIKGENGGFTTYVITSQLLQTRLSQHSTFTSDPIRYEEEFLPFPREVPEIPPVETEMRNTRQHEPQDKEHLRPLFMVTLSHAERGNRALLDKGDGARRVDSIFKCKSLVVSRESHTEQYAYHFLHILGFSKSNRRKRIYHR